MTLWCVTFQANNTDVHILKHLCTQGEKIAAGDGAAKTLDVFHRRRKHNLLTHMQLRYGWQEKHITLSWLCITTLKLETQHVHLESY